MDIGQTSATAAAPVASLKNKKAIFKQQSLGLDQAVSTISERLNFHTYLQSVTEPLTEFPVAHLPLIAKLIHESEETYHHAATRVHKLLTAQAPSANATESGEPALSKSVVEAAVKKLADRVNWGVDNGVASATLWRLEVKDRDMLPPEFRQVCEERWKERNRAKADIQAALSALPEPDRAQYLKSGGNTASTSTLADKDVVMKSPSKADKAGESSTKKGAGKSKKVVDVETTAKEKEKQEKKSAKEEEDKKVAEDTKKRAAAFASFFTPARPATTRIKPAQDAELSDWQKTFYPFIVKKDTVIAPINRFAQSAPRKSSNPGNALEQLLGQRLPKSRQTLVSSRPRQNLEVRAIMQELTDAEVVGDSKTVRRLTNLLKNRRALPAKLLHFRENARPAYYGTWTRSSPHIGPRRPFGKDESLDYDYDSGEDWEEEGDGEVIVSDGSDEEDSGSDEDEEGWLVDDDEAEGPDDAMDESSDTAVKRKVKSSNEKDTKRRRVEKLTPFQKGPCWEEGIGECSYDAFNAYRIQLLNDCPYPVDPFTFIPAKLEEPAPTKAENATAAAQAPTFAVPVAPGTDEASRPPVPGTLNRVPSVAKKQIDPASIKHPFPEIYLSELYSLIEGSEKTLKGLVEDLYLALKKYPGVKKYAIEAKLREVADKGRSADTPAKRWRVSDEAWAAIGVARPGPS